MEITPHPEGPTHVGTVGILTAEAGRFARFWHSILQMGVPGSVNMITKFSLNIAQARNEILDEARGDWVWFMDDDHIFDPQLLVRLLARGVDVIQPLVLSRYAPFAPVAMGPPTSGGVSYWRYALQPGESGLKRVRVVGCAGMLVRRHVWEAIEKPRFEMGQVARDAISEDVTFCQKVRQAGFQVYLDLDNTMDHMNVGAVRPVRKPDGTWVTMLMFGNAVIEIPAAAPKYAINHETGEVEPIAEPEGHEGIDPSR